MIDVDHNTLGKVIEELGDISLVKNSRNEEYKGVKEELDDFLDIVSAYNMKRKVLKKNALKAQR